jgi:hypothetical protein
MDSNPIFAIFAPETRLGLPYRRPSSAYYYCCCGFYATRIRDIASFALLLLPLDAMMEPVSVEEL